MTAHLTDVKTNIRFGCLAVSQPGKILLTGQLPTYWHFFFIVSANAAQVIEKLEENEVLVDAFTYGGWLSIQVAQAKLSTQIIVKLHLLPKKTVVVL